MTSKPNSPQPPLASQDRKGPAKPQGAAAAGGYDGQKDLAGSLDVGYSAIRERVAAGGPGWVPK